MDAKIDIRAYLPGDEHDLAALFGRCFGRRIDAPYWLWKLKNHESDFENVWVVTADGQPVAQYVGIPVAAQVRGERCQAIVILDTMVDPRMRRQGILGLMGQHAHDQWRRAGVHFAIGLPNEQWGSRARLLGWRSLFPLRWLVRVLRPERIAARRLGLPHPRYLAPLGGLWRLATARKRIQFEVEPLTRANNDLDEIAAASGADSTISLLRGSAWVDRRYLSCPGSPYRVLIAREGRAPVGYAVFRLRGGTVKTVVIAEVVTHSGHPASFPALIGEIERLSLDADAESVQTLAVPGSASYRDWRRCGYLPRRAAFDLQYVPFQSRYERFGKVDDWTFFPGDFDVV